MRVIVQGLGFIGRLTARACVEKGLDLVGCTDVDEELVGKDLGDLIGLERTGVRVTADLEQVVENERADFLISCTTSFVDEAYSHFMPALRRGINVISTCETLVYPYHRYPEVAERIDAMARENGARVIGAGINPGYLLDVLPAFLTAPIQRINRIRCTRQVDASKRRPSFRRKIGLGLTEGEFAESLKVGKITGHVGMTESALLLADCLKVRVVEVTESQTPILARADLGVNGAPIRSRTVAGIEARSSVRSDECLEIELVFRAGVSLEEYEEVSIEGEPSVVWRSSGVPGDVSTAAYIVNLIPRVLELSPGLRLVSDLRLPSWWRGVG
ncbi:MAG: dihydrodipicolinate reductase [Aigarchaeota archaeon]|nr:dihydrodipicolinate reductase [Aigarchaeota archaeon]MDW8093271.1 dihydrodipicolinate reductase [Nitrososphaerota archaeon]